MPRLIRNKSELRNWDFSFRFELASNWRKRVCACDMSNYRTVVVGTDGSGTSLRAVDRAGAIAAESDARLVIAMGCQGRLAARKSSKILREARDRAEAAGANNIDERPIREAPADALVNLAEEVEADLVVVGNVGLNPIILGRMFSVPGNVSSKATTDVLVVHTTD